MSGKMAPIGRMIGEYLKEKPHAKVGFIIHGAMFYGTTERDNCAEKILRESYPDIEITARKGFIQIENAYKVCYEMINEHPDIQALYVSWDRPARHQGPESFEPDRYCCLYHGSGF